MAENHLIIIGHSLADKDIREEIEGAIRLQKAAGGAEVTILCYERDMDRAALLESRGLQVCFGGLDDFFASLVRVH